MTFYFDCIDLTGSAKRQDSLAQRAAESKALLDERKRTALTTSPQPSKRRRSVEDDIDDEPLFNRVQQRRQAAAMFSTPAPSQDLPSASQDPP
ncbi:hypothetical protein BGX24_006414, partial [Mortierella sp. AD032]